MLKPCNICTYIAGYNPAWKDIFNSVYMDEMYILRSGSKICSALLQAYAGDGGAISEKDKQHIAQLIAMAMSDNWTMYVEVLRANAYNPLQNYDMSEEGTDTHSNMAKTDSSSTENYSKDFHEHENSVDDYTIVKNGMETHTVSDNKQDVKKVGNNSDSGDVTTDESMVSAFNSNSYSASEKNSTVFKPNHSETSTTTGGSTDILDFNGRNDKEDRTVDTERSDTGSDERTATGSSTNSDSGEIKHKFVRAGNIGVMSSQNLAQQELELRHKEVLLDKIFESMDKLLTLGIYF